MTTPEERNELLILAERAHHKKWVFGIDSEKASTTKLWVGFALSPFNYSKTEQQAREMAIDDKRYLLAAANLAPVLVAEVEALTAEVEANRWIPISEGLPESSIENQVEYLSEGMALTGYFIVDDDDKWFEDYDGWRTYPSKVTHWKYVVLPALPEIKDDSSL